MNKKKISTMHLPVDISYLPAAQAFINELARLAKFSQKDITFFNVAVEEAITNVVKHAFLPDEDAAFDIICELTPVEFKVIIRDKGLPFDPTQVEDFSPEQSLDGNEQVGLGFRLMKGSVDQLSFHNMGYGGKEVHLVKFVDQKHVEKYFQKSEMEAFEQPTYKSKKERVKIPFHVLLLQQKQAIEISQCAYRTYGYTYIMENIYYPDRLIEMTRTGELISAVAVCDENNEVMGHCALERFGRKKDIPEMGMAFTKPKFRGQGCMTMLNELLTEQAKEKGIKGMFAKGVTTHPYSQKALLRSRFKDCAILIGLSPPKTFEGMEEQGAQRETLIVCYFKLIDQDLKIYATPDHKDMIEKIYQNIGIDAKVLIPENSKTGSTGMVQSDVEVEVKDLLNFANIYINDCGENIKLEIDQRVRELCQKKIETINLYLDLCDENSVSYVADMEDLGFFFAGVFPSDQKQYLVLQYLNNVPIDYNKIVLVSDFAQELGQYVKGCDPNQK
ncbi:MAG: GNAT family N-acetyltransferase [Candidatus Cloacimonetes bacterium]|nr:GNAT family N-acetyltransferase [Candidatus Cloacimonadota bacterium]